LLSTIFTQLERISINKLSQTDVNAADFLFIFSSANAGQINVYSDDANLLKGLDYFSKTPTSSPCLANGRKDEIIAAINSAG
jgi:hypothetical protein